MCVSIVGWYALFFGKKPFVFEVPISNGFEVYDSEIFYMLIFDGDL